MSGHRRVAQALLLALCVTGCQSPTVTSGRFHPPEPPGITSQDPSSEAVPSPGTGQGITGAVTLSGGPVAGALISVYQPSTGSHAVGPTVQADDLGRFHIPLPDTGPNASLFLITAAKGGWVSYALYWGRSAKMGTQASLAPALVVDVASSIVAKVLTSAFLPLLVSQPTSPTLTAGSERARTLQQACAGLSPGRVRDVRLSRALTQLSATPTAETLQTTAEAVVDYSPLQSAIYGLVSDLQAATATAGATGGQAVYLPIWRFGAASIRPEVQPARPTTVDITSLIAAADTILHNRGPDNRCCGGSGGSETGSGTGPAEVNSHLAVLPGSPYAGPVGFQP